MRTHTRTGSFPSEPPASPVVVAGVVVVVAVSKKMGVVFEVVEGEGGAGGGLGDDVGPAEVVGDFAEVVLEAAAGGAELGAGAAVEDEVVEGADGAGEVEGGLGGDAGGGGDQGHEEEVGDGVFVGEERVDEEGVGEVEDRDEDDAHEDFPGAHDVLAFDFDAGARDRGLCLLGGEDFRGDEQWRRQEQARHEGDDVRDEQGEAHPEDGDGVDGVDDGLVLAALRDAPVVELVLLQLFVVLGDAFHEVLDLRQVLVGLEGARDAARDRDLAVDRERVVVGDEQSPQHVQQFLRLVVGRLHGHGFDRREDVV